MKGFNKNYSCFFFFKNCRQHFSKFYFIPIFLVVPAKILKSPDTVTVNEGDIIQLTCEFQGKPVPKATWTCNNVTLSPSDHYKVDTADTSITLTIPKATKTDDNTYTLTVENPSGKDQTDVVVHVKGRFLQS